MRQFLRLLPILLQCRPGQSNALIESYPLLDPIFMPGLPAPARLWLRRTPRKSRPFDPARNRFDHLVRLDEKLQFHLFEFPRSKSEVARRHFVSKRLADLRDPKRHLLPGGFQHVLKLSKDRLRRLRSEIRNG